MEGAEVKTQSANQTQNNQDPVSSNSSTEKTDAPINVTEPGNLLFKIYARLINPSW
jgi:hypothetical protein